MRIQTRFVSPFSIWIYIPNLRTHHSIGILTLPNPAKANHWLSHWLGPVVQPFLNESYKLFPISIQVIEVIYNPIMLKSAWNAIGFTFLICAMRYAYLLVRELAAKGWSVNQLVRAYCNRMLDWLLMLVVCFIVFMLHSMYCFIAALSALLSVSKILVFIGDRIDVCLKLYYYSTGIVRCIFPYGAVNNQVFRLPIPNTERLVPF
jgi:hypothetical protein